MWTSLKRIRWLGQLLLVLLVLVRSGTAGGSDGSKEAQGKDEHRNNGDRDSATNLFSFANSTGLLLKEQLPKNLQLDHIEELIMDPLNRTKRQSLAALAGLGLAQPFQAPSANYGNGNSVEGLLASCQLTNLLMYQLLQQKQQQLQLNAISPVAGPLGINQNLVIPPMETLSTYVSTSTYVKTMTTTALVTIPLLFGNKPVPTTITRTKTYEVTTSELVTLTSTIRPMTTQMPAAALMSVAEINPTASVTEVLSATAVLDDQKAQVAGTEENAEVASETPPERSRIADSVTDDKKGTRRGGVGKRRKSRPAGKIGADNLHQNLATVAPKEVIRSRDSAQYKILRDNRERSRYEPAATPAPAPARGQSQRNSNNNNNFPPVNQYAPRNSFGQHAEQQQVQYKGTYVQEPEVPLRGVPIHQQQQQQHQQVNYRRPVELVDQQQSYRRPAEVVEEVVEDDPEYIQYPDDYSYYARRLKRGQQHRTAATTAKGTDAQEEAEEEYPLEREYLLEPSFQEDFSQHYEARQKCPPVPPAVPPPPPETVTVTETRTITKWVNPSTASTPALPASATHDTLGGSSGRSRGRARYRSTTTTTTTEPPVVRQPNINNNNSGRRWRPSRIRTEDYYEDGSR